MDRAALPARLWTLIVPSAFTPGIARYAMALIVVVHGPGAEPGRHQTHEGAGGWPHCGGQATDTDAASLMARRLARRGSGLAELITTQPQRNLSWGMQDIRDSAGAASAGVHLPAAPTYRITP